MTDSETYIAVLGNLARAAPHEWKAFLDSFRKHVENAKDLAIATDGHNAPISVGMAREATKLLSDFENAVVNADRMLEKMALRPKK